MLNCIHSILRVCQRIGFIRFRGRVIATTTLALLLPVIASAYTVVLRDGRLIAVPDSFQVTQTALTYETTHGIFVTIQMTSIDIDATDMANGSPQGTLLGRVGQGLEPKAPVTGKSVPRRATRTLTNLDLEQTRLKRIESEAAYEVRRKELGLPSREETERRIQEEAARARELLAQSEIERAESENYWRTRATELRSEILVLDSEIDYVRVRLADWGGSFAVGSFVTFGNPVSYVASFGRQQAPPVSVNRGPAGIRQTNAPIVPTVGAQPRQQVSSNSFGSLDQGRRFNSCRFPPCGPVFGVTYPYNYNSYDRSQLIARLQELEAIRARLAARWQLLEDDARRAGAQPGWLRP